MGASRATLEYWRNRVRKNSFLRKDGSTYTNPNYELVLRFGPKQQRFNLESGNKEIAANKALEIWMYYKSNGEEAVVKKYKEKSTTTPELEPTVGLLLTEIENLRLIKAKTFAVYSRKFRRLVSGVCNITTDESKYDYQGTGYEKWRGKIDSIKLSALTPQKIMRWRATYLKKASQDPLSQKKARSTLTSLFRNSKTLFSNKYISLLSFQIPQNPFQDITIGGSTTRQYHSEIDFLSLAKTAKDDLFINLSQVPQVDPSNKRKTTQARNDALSKREQFKILLLCLGCGLRRNEADNIPWHNVDFHKKKIKVEATINRDIKADSSERLIDVDTKIIALLKQFKSESNSEFVIESKVSPNPEATYDFYRCNTHFKKLITWLREQGVIQKNALHELRKEYGSQLTEQFGIYAASKALGHAEVTTTARSYLEQKGKKTVSIF